MKYEHLFTPITLGDTEFRNRIFAAPIGLEYYTNERYHPDDAFIAFFERKAQGGAATVSIGSVMADNSRGAVGGTMRLDDPSALAPLYRLSQCISRHGAVADIELQHCGANSYYSKLGLGNEIYGAFDCKNGLGMDIPEMPEDVILETIQKFGDAAMVAKHCGYGMVTVHAGHGWLFNQFLGPKNNRDDQWGGTMENRARFICAVGDEMKKRCGKGFPTCVRISGAEIFEGGYDIDYGVEIAKQLDGHFDIINVSVGAHEAPSVFTVTHPSMFLEDGCNVKYAAAVKKAVKTSKVATVGALAEPDLLEEIIASGQADIVMMCREMICDPDMPLKARCGKEADIRKCLRCFDCFSGHFTLLSNRCAINPEIGFERETRYIDPVPAHRERVLVVGGGVGGMQAALTAHDRGHEVILCEKGSELGGSLRCERKVPFKQNLQYYLDQQARRVGEAGIDLRLDTEVTPDLAREIAPDAIIVAAGSTPAKPDIPGIDGRNVIQVEEALLDADKLGDDIIMLGGGLSAIESAIYFSSLGKTVKIMIRGTALNFSGNVIHQMAIENELKRYKIEVLSGTNPVEITGEGVMGEFVGDRYAKPAPCETLQRGMLQSAITTASLASDVEKGEKKLYPADTVVYALGQVPSREIGEKLRDCAPLFYEVGDCVKPENIYIANSQAYTIARDLGRY